jgi:hypothetical protein
MPAYPRSAKHLELAMLVGVSMALLAARLFAATRIGFGDSESLYASYALHPQPAYLDHPGLIGMLARGIGGGSAPRPELAHVVTSLLATFVPWTMALACRACGATWRRSFAGALIFALTPEIAIGLFAMTPDLLLALAWTAALALGSCALRSSPGSVRSSAAFAATGLLGGVAAAAKVSGLMLIAGLAITYASRAARPHARTAAPWAGLAAAAIVLLPIAWFEARSGWPMLRHRLVDTQGAAALSLRNGAALLGGQIAYLSPLTAALAVLAARAVWRGRGDATGHLLLATCLAPLAVLVPLCLWSRTAEPHWLAPAWLALVPAAARADIAPSRRLVVASSVLAGTMVTAGHVWALTPSLLRLLPASYEPRLDLANELYGWPDVMRAVREEVRGAAPIATVGQGDVAVVGPHWVICAQLEAALAGQVAVGCDSAIRDDFDDWWPRAQWRSADVIVWVTDNRFPDAPELPMHALTRTREVRIDRGGRMIRLFAISVLVRSARAAGDLRVTNRIALRKTDAGSRPGREERDMDRNRDGAKRDHWVLFLD